MFTVDATVAFPIMKQVVFFSLLYYSIAIFALCLRNKFMLFQEIWMDPTLSTKKI